MLSLEPANALCIALCIVDALYGNQPDFLDWFLCDRKH